MKFKNLPGAHSLRAFTSPPFLIMLRLAVPSSPMTVRGTSGFFVWSVAGWRAGFRSEDSRGEMASISDINVELEST